MYDLQKAYNMQLLQNKFIKEKIVNLIYKLKKDQDLNEKIYSNRDYEKYVQGNQKRAEMDYLLKADAVKLIEVLQDEICMQGFGADA